MLFQPRQQHPVLYENELVKLRLCDCCVLQHRVQAVVGGAYPGWGALFKCMPRRCRGGGGGVEARMHIAGPTGCVETSTALLGSGTLLRTTPTCKEVGG
jgi:hypothetical protein